MSKTHYNYDYLTFFSMIIDRYCRFMETLISKKTGFHGLPFCAFDVLAKMADGLFWPAFGFYALCGVFLLWQVI